MAWYDYLLKIGLPIVSSICLTIITYLKLIVKKVSEKVAEYEQVPDHVLLASYNDNPNSKGKNKEGASVHERANALRRRLVMSDVMSSYLTAPKWLIKRSITKCCMLNKLPDKKIEGGEKSDERQD